jgi:hypothetical protein
MKKIISVLYLFILPFMAFAQEDTTIEIVEIQANGLERRWHTEDPSNMTALQLHEDSLVYLADSMYESATPLARENANYQFIRTLKNTVKLNGAANYNFSALSKKINILSSADNSFKIYNWEIIRNNNEHRYYGVIVKQDGSLIPLIDISGKLIAGEEDSVFTNSRWYGGSYYKMIEQKVGGKPAYFLLGFNGNNPNYNIKFMDVLQFNDKKEAAFGGPYCMNPNKKGNPICNRYILYYQKDTRVSFNMDTELNMIIHDHLESSTGDPAKRTTLVPDGTYDGLSWKGKGWVLVPNAVKIEILKDGQAPNEVPATEAPKAATKTDSKKPTKK